MIKTFDELVQKIEADGKNSFNLRQYRSRFIQAKKKLENVPENHTAIEFDCAFSEKSMYENMLDGMLLGLETAGVIDDMEVTSINKDLFGEET